jgi:dihydrofolate synthase/folylpolyglutamate synthase
MNYDETLKYLFNLERFGMKLDLSNITAILNLLDNPHLQYPTIHIAGTNGKGSVAAMLHSVLRDAGYKAGLYTSPHLVDFRERIKTGRELIEKDFIGDFVHRLKDHIDRRGFTFFEVVTGMAFEYFAQNKVDIAVIETGLGGRLDATNMIAPLMSIITNIGREHTQQLGEVVAQIANEKAGIVKRGVPTITAVTQPEALDAIRAVCKQRKSELVHVQDVSGCQVLEASILVTGFNFFSNSTGYQNLRMNLAGKHQLLNACTALTAVQELRKLGWGIDESAVRSGLRQVDWRARLEVLRKQPLVFLDVAHNAAGMKALIDSLDELLPAKRIIFVLGVMEDKDHALMLAELTRKAKFVVLTKPEYKKAADPEVLGEMVQKTGLTCEIIPKVQQAYLSALDRAEADDVVCVTGSHFTVGELLSSLEPDSREINP